MATLSFKHIFLCLVVTSSLVSCKDTSMNIKVPQQQALIQYINKNLSKFKIVTYKDADLYNDTIEESKRFSRLGMVNLSKYFDKNRLKKIQIKFDDYFEKATSEYYFNHGKLFYVKKIEVFGPHKKEISHFYFNGNRLEKCIMSHQKSCLNEKKIILHDIVRYIKYPEKQ